MTSFTRFLRFFVVCASLVAVAYASADLAAEVESEGDKNSCVNQECANPDAVPAYRNEDPKCPSRQHVTLCAGQYLDSNQNGKLERAELQAAIDSLPWYGRGILNILGSVDKMMAKCDVDKDDAISMGYDMVHNAETCLATCFKRMAFKKAFFPDCTL
jgi:hypothetical protein